MYKALEKKDTKEIDISLSHEAFLHVCLEKAKDTDNMKVMKTVFDICVLEGKLEMVKYLIEKVANTSALHSHIKAKSKHVLCQLCPRET